MSIYNTDGSRHTNNPPNGVTRAEELQKFLYDSERSTNGFVSKFLKDEKNAVAVAWFGSSWGKLAGPYGYGFNTSIKSPPYEGSTDYRYGYPTYVNNEYNTALSARIHYSLLDDNNEAGISLDWLNGSDYTSSAFRPTKSDFDNVSGDKGATDYISGLWQGLDMLQSDAVKNDEKKKIVVFLSDGAPTVYVGNQKVGTGAGDVYSRDYWQPLSDTKGSSGSNHEAEVYATSQTATYQDYLACLSKIMFYLLYL